MYYFLKMKRNKGVSHVDLENLKFWKTEYEKNRDRYFKLHTKLENYYDEHNRKVGEAETTYSSYNHGMPYLSGVKIPSSDFNAKRMELNERLQNVFAEDKGKKLELKVASEKAYERYEYYRDLATSQGEKYDEEMKKQQEEA